MTRSLQLARAALTVLALGAPVAVAQAADAPHHAISATAPVTQDAVTATGTATTTGTDSAGWQ
ncbi:hypothetical protein AB0G79_20805 [Streptomyces sp. NPDC020807]|uniref:hypothetical protein n=1 Tax=Streptomyces sp. NPDC020807 TaxID=3155119 RepID=UPI0033D16E90